MGRIALLSWLLTFVLSYFVAGGYLGRLLEGTHRDTLSSLPLVVTGVALLASLALTGLWMVARPAGLPARPAGLPARPAGLPARPAGLPARPAGLPARPAGLPALARGGRRRFLLGVLGAGGGIIATAVAAIARNAGWYRVTARNIFLVRPPYKADVYLDAWSGSRVVEYRRLGRTGARVSDISLGSGGGTGGRQTAEVAREAIERGINYFDTSPDYAETGSEQILGEAMQGLRERMFVATKFCTPGGHLGPGSSVEDYMQAVEGSLRRLHTDWVDLVHIHACDSRERLMDENAHEAFDRLKQQGKARFLGVSTHTPNLELVANTAIDSGRFDVLMLAYHFGAWPKLGEIIDRAAREDVAVVAMKTLRGAKHQGLPWSGEERDSFTQAAFKWVLSNPSVSCLVISLWESAQLDEFLFASGKRLGPRDQAVLQRYETLTAGAHCRSHCGACLARCPERLRIDDVLRYRMYFEDYGAEKEAIRLYAALDTRADACLGCSAPCASACPHGVAIPERTREAHRLLSFA